MKLSQAERKIYVSGMLYQFLASENAELVAMRRVFDGAEKITDKTTFAEIWTIGMQATKESIPDMSGLDPASG